MDVDEIAHASGVVFCRSPLGDFDLAPRTMNVEENEEIDRTIATILVIVTFELTRPGLARRRRTVSCDRLIAARAPEVFEGKNWPLLYAAWPEWSYAWSRAKRAASLDDDLP